MCFFCGQLTTCTNTHTHTHTQVKRKKSLHPTPTRLSSGDWFDVVETNYTFADAATAATVSTDIDSVSSWEERLLICHAYRQACLQQLARVVRKLFKGLAYHVYEIWRDEAIQGLDKHRLTICQDYLIIMLESIVECSMVNNADMLETVKTHTGVDWEHGVEEVSCPLPQIVDKRYSDGRKPDRSWKRPGRPCACRFERRAARLSPI